MWTYTGCCARESPAPVRWPQHVQYSHWGSFNPGSFNPKELSADKITNTAQATIGGVEPVFLSLEYLKDAGAETPSVKITITDSSGTGEWNVTTIPDGFNVKLDFAAACPNATVKLDVNGCTAQLNWFERVYS
jgi:hypothetical protein